MILKQTYFINVSTDFPSTTNQTFFDFMRSPTESIPSVNVDNVRKAVKFAV